MLELEQEEKKEGDEGASRRKPMDDIFPYFYKEKIGVGYRQKKMLLSHSLPAMLHFAWHYSIEGV